MLIEVTDNNHEDILAKGGVVMIDFGAEWCGPCQKLAPIIAEMADEYEGRAVIARADIDECIDLTAKYKILSVPTVLFFKDGELRNRNTGFEPKEALAKKLEELL